ncbi:MAG: hypothetical protein KJ697_03095 [Nanoarchaeota archaeon]|nr:hypothetical protein [Nanoarchaeota archaeon]
MSYVSHVIGVLMEEIEPMNEYNTHCRNCGDSVQGQALCYECTEKLNETLESVERTIVKKNIEVESIQNQLSQIAKTFL